MHTRGLTAIWTPRAAADSGAGTHSSLAGRILAGRGVTAPEELDAFLNPTLSQLHDPSDLPGLDDAAKRLVRAAKRGEPIVIYGDYDVDGVTATAILWHTLRAIAPSASVRSYVPHRLDEGYGLNPEAIAALADEGAAVIVTVDCGVTAAGPARVARDRGVDLIITDHHNLPDDRADLPDCFATVHPRLPGSGYPFGDLCGAGVAYKLAWRMLTLAAGSPRVSARDRSLLLHLLALASLGVIADVVPLQGENRIIARYGLQRIKQSAIAGLRALVDAAGLAGEDIDAERVAFTLAPRLNACGRLGHAREAVRMLTEASYEEAYAIAQDLSSKNDERRRIEQRIVEEATELAEANGMTGPDRRAIVLSSEAWHPGVVGIACSRLVERFHRPTILLCEADGVCTGSGRSVDGVSIHAALVDCAHLLDRWGGHDMAAGLTIAREHLDEFIEAFVTRVNTDLSADRLVRTIRFDCDVELAELSMGAVEELARLGPFGAENPSIRVRLCGLEIAEQPRRVGSGGKHLSMRVRSGGRWLKLIAWRWGEHAEGLPRGSVIDALVTPKVSSWQGVKRVEAEMHDLRLHT